MIETEFIKQNLKTYYNQEAELRNVKFAARESWKIQAREKFCALIKRENKMTLLELGAGAGYDSLFFMDNDMNVTAVDLSAEMVKFCRAKGIETYELDFYNLSSLNKKFDSVYALNTLLHVPQTDLSRVFNEIHSVLEPNGLFYMGLCGGQDIENEIINSEVSNAPRFFVFNSKDFLQTALENYFDILNFETLDISRQGGEGIFHSITLRKKST